MNKSDVVEVLEEIAVLLELKGENPFKSRAYSQGARTLELLTEDLGTIIKEDRLGAIKGIGAALQQKITELVATGKLGYYDELKASIPEGMLAMLEIQGLGPKRIRQLHEKLGIASIADLEKACQENKVSELAGFGEKSQTKLIEGIAQLKSFQNQHLYGDVIDRAEEIQDLLRQHPDVIRVSVAGSLRRSKEVIKDMDLLVSSSNPQAVMDDFVAMEGVVRVTNHGETKSSVILEGGLQCDLRVVPDAQFASALHHFTGSKEHNVAMRQRAIAQGKKVSEWGLFKITKKGDEEIEEPITVRTEEELFAELGLSFIPPELREAQGEIEAAEEQKIPRLLEWTELRGCFHNHTVASDGKNTLVEMADAAQELGLEYLGIADHSKSSFQANGLSEERLLAQVEEIQKLNKTYKDFKLLSGVECDILKGGELDFEDSVLEKLDYVVASVHSSFTGTEEEMTVRIIRAMENPHVTMLGHLTGRLLLQRAPYALNVPKILEAAVETGTWIELNANPSRLDMDWRWWRKARDLGVLCVINPDAHRLHQLGYLKLGVQIARKGWLRKQDVINCLPLSKVEQVL
ncbi:MAG: DNA polymerase/3'-5' exonuclease PolX, partial [Verrucomicrobiota bacterium]